MASGQCPATGEKAISYRWLDKALLISLIIFPKGERGESGTEGETIQLEDQAMIAGIQVWLLSSEW